LVNIIEFDRDLCLTCRTCELACAVAHSKSGNLAEAVSESPLPRKRMILTSSAYGPESLRCRQCGEPLCVFACKSGALSRDPASGRITIEDDRCVGCWMCYMVCATGIMPEIGTGAALRCDICSDLDSPACLEACPTGALSITEREDSAEQKSDFTGRIVVVGASAAGLAACEAAREYAPGAEIIVAAADTVFGYSRPMLPYLQADDAAEAKLEWRSAEFLEKELGIRLVKGKKAVGLDPETRTVTLEDGDTLSCDRLVIATGARGAKPDIPGIDLEGVFLLRDMDDMIGINRTAVPGAGAVVLGGGNVGLQTCEALLRRGVKTTVVVRSPHLLSQMVDGEAGRRVGDLFSSHGLDIRTGRGVAGIKGDDRVEGVQLDNGELIEANLVVVGKGIEPNVEWLEGSGLAIGRGISVDNYGRTNLPGIFAAGDCAETVDPHSGEPSVSGIWPVAYEMGRAAGAAAVGVKKAGAGALSKNASRFFDTAIISIGEVRPGRIEDAVTVVLSNSDESYRKLVFENGLLLGALLYGDITGAGLFYRLYRDKVEVSREIRKRLTADNLFRLLTPLVST